MNIQCTNYNTFVLTDESKELGQLIYKSIFSFKATISDDSRNYEIVPTGFWGTTISVKENAIEIASLKMNWKGNIIIAFQNGNTYILKTTGMFLSKYVVEDNNHQKIMQLNANFNWSKFNYNYSITYNNKPTNILLVLLAVYSSNYFITTMSVAM